VLSVSKEFVIQNNLRQLEILIEQISAFCTQVGIPENLFFDIRLAIEEAVSNTIRHGYDDQQSHSISLRTEMRHGNLFLQIEDDAKAFNPLEAADPDLNLPIEEKQPGGLGIYLIKAMMDDVEYERVDNKNILKMKKAVADASTGEL
jgi:serine/threonine-protein kinase RsbW